MARVQNPNRPLSGWQFAPNVGSNTATYPDTWVDLTSRVVAWDSHYGKQRELGLAESGTATVTCRDIDEYLNPANTSSPWNSSGNSLKLYRMIRHWEMTPLTGNMINGTNDVWLQVRTVTTSYSDTAWFETGTVGAWMSQGSATITNSTARAHDGTHSGLVTWATQTGGGETAGIGCFGLPLRTGETYTLSVLIWITSGPAVSISINNAVATSTATTGAWQRVVLTSTATDGVSSNMFIYPSGSTTAGQNISIDSVQLERAASASAFTSNGPTIYPVFTGYIERYPNTWKYNGYEGQCQLQCVDALGMMPRVEFMTSLEMEIDQDVPDYWWGFDDNIQAGGYFTNKGGTKDPSLQDWGGLGGAGASATTGSGVGPGPDQPSVLTVTPVWHSTTEGSQPPDYGALWFNSWSGSQIGGTAAGFTLEFWFQCVNTNYWAQHLFTAAGTNLNDVHDEYQFYIQSSGHLSYYYYNASTTRVEEIDSSAYVFDGNWHHVVLTTSSNGTTITSQLWLDGSSVGTFTRSGSSIPVRNKFLIGSQQDGSAWGMGYQAGGGPFLQGSFSNLAIYQGYTLPSARITAHYVAGSSAHALEKAGGRILRTLAYAGWQVIGTGVNSGAGVEMGPTRGMGGKTCADILKVIGDTDQGLIIADPSGQLTFIPQATIAALTSTATFGENAAGGEIPYLEGATAELEPSQVYNTITVNPYELKNNDAYLTSVVYVDATSVSDYGYRSLSVDILPVDGDDGLTQIDNMASFLLTQKANPRLMVTGVVVPASKIPALWSTLLALRVGQRVTWKRRTSAGLTMAIDGYIQTIAWSETPEEGAHVTIDIEPIQA